MNPNSKLYRITLKIYLTLKLDKLRARYLKKNIPHKDIVEFYNYVNNDPLGYDLNLTVDSVPKNSIQWVIPNFGFGSGGHLNIFRFAYMLEKRGFTNQSFVIVGGNSWHSPDEALTKIQEWFFPLNATVSFGKESLKPSMFTIATSWHTAYPVNNFSDTLHKLYFVQDFEPSFYAVGSEYAFAENTYKMGLTAITAGDWLAQKLQDEYGMETHPLAFSFDKALYKPVAKKENTKRHVFFYARPPTERRAFELGLLALDALCKKYDDLAIIFAGWDVREYRIDFPHLNAGIVKIEELPDLYSQCDVALVLSLTNLSLLPLEIMACECPVVINSGENNQWLLPDDVVKYTDLNPQAIVDSISAILDNPIQTHEMIDKAKKHADSTSWGEEAEKLIAILQDIQT